MTGKCHICWKHTEIAYCKTCGHWFCAKCREKWTERMFQAIKHLVNPQDKCCG